VWLVLYAYFLPKNIAIILSPTLSCINYNLLLVHHIHQVCLGLEALGNATIRSSQGFQAQVVLFKHVPFTFITPNASSNRGFRATIDDCVIFYPTQIKLYEMKHHFQDR
jgi:hypothetical protein